MQHSHFFLFNDTPTTEIYTLSLHDALPISAASPRPPWCCGRPSRSRSSCCSCRMNETDRKSTRLNSSHRCISYAVFCLKKKNCDEHDYLCMNHGAQEKLGATH